MSATDELIVLIYISLALITIVQLVINQRRNK